MNESYIEVTFHNLSADEAELLIAQLSDDDFYGFEEEENSLKAYIDETLCGISNYLKLYQKQQAKLLNSRGKIPTDHPESVITTWALSFKKIKKASRVAENRPRYGRK